MEYSKMDRGYGKSENASMLKKRQSMMEEQHNSSNAFVKSQQEGLKSLQGRVPNMPQDAMAICHNMMSDGKHAQELARSATAGLDKKAFPVK